MPPPRRKRQARQEPSREPVAVRLRWEGVERMPILYANQIFVRLQDRQILITFGQYQLPHEIEFSEETRRRLQEEGGGVQTIARLAVEPENLGVMIRHLTQVYDTWRRAQETQSTQAAVSEAR